TTLFRSARLRSSHSPKWLSRSNCAGNQSSESASRLRSGAVQLLAAGVAAFVFHPHAWLDKETSRADARPHLTCHWLAGRLSGRAAVRLLATARQNGRPFARRRTGDGLRWVLFQSGDADARVELAARFSGPGVFLFGDADRQFLRFVAIDPAQSGARTGRRLASVHAELVRPDSGAVPAGLFQ